MALSRRRFIVAAGCVSGGAMVGRHDAAAAATPTPTLTLTCANYVRFMPIAAGDVAPDNLKLTWVRGDRNEMLRRATDDATIDGGESSMAQHVMRLDRGDRSLVAIPIFPLRNFTARDLYTRKEQPIAVESLGGRRIGVYSWAASGAVWYRHLLRYFGHDTRKMTWVVGGVDGPANVIMPDPPLPNVTAAPKGSSLSDLLLTGKIDALFAPLPAKVRHRPRSTRARDPWFPCGGAEVLRRHPVLSAAARRAAAPGILGARSFRGTAARGRPQPERRRIRSRATTVPLQLPVADRGRGGGGARDGR